MASGDQCGQIWRNFATLTKSLWAKFWSVNLTFTKLSNLFGNILMSLGKFWLMQMAKFWKNILAISSHWWQRPVQLKDGSLLKTKYNKNNLGNGCVSVGRAVASNSRGPQFESSHKQKFIYIDHLFTVNCVLKRWNKEKEAGNGLFKKIKTT